jgi:uncharacterized protein YjbI with pentapeptide repeats
MRDKRSRSNIRRVRSGLFRSAELNGLVEDLKKLHAKDYPSDMEVLSCLWGYFVYSPFPQSAFDSIDDKKLQKWRNNELKGAISIIKDYAPIFFDSLLNNDSLFVDNSLTESKIENTASFPSSLEKILEGFYLFWSFLKKFFPAENLVDSIETSKVIVDLFRLDKILSPSKGYDFSHQHFFRPNFANLNLKSDSFEYCRLFEADFSYCIIENVSFRKAKFAQYQDEYTEQESDEFSSNENFINEAFSGKFIKSNFQNTCFDGIISKNLNFSTSEGSHLYFQAANLEGGIFSRCNWQEVDFTSAKLIDSDFSWAHIERLSISDVSSFRDAVFSDATIHFKWIKNDSDLDRQNQLRANLLSDVKTLYKTIIHERIKEIILLQKGGVAGQKNINKALFYAPDELDLDPIELKKREKKGYETINSIEIPIDEDLYLFTSSLKTTLNEQLEILNSRITFYQLENLSKFIDNFRDLLLEAKEQWESQYFFKILSESKTHLENGELKLAFTHLEKLNLPQEFHKQYDTLKIELNLLEKQPADDRVNNLIEQTHTLVQMLLNFVLESTD